MANGDYAAANGLGANIVPATDDIRNGWDWINKLADVVAALLVRLNAVQAPGTSIEGYWNVAPTGYVLENGASYSTATYPALFAVIGYTYGGAGASFNVPDSRGRVTVAKSASGAFATMGGKTGTETVALTAAQNGPHTHDYAWGGVNVTPGGGVAAMYPVGFDSARATTQSGSGQAHTNLQPSITLNRAIKL